jgi:hypothetical protein
MVCMRDGWTDGQMCIVMPPKTFSRTSQTKCAWNSWAISWQNRHLDVSWCISIMCVCVYGIYNPWSVSYSDTHMYHMNHMYLITFEQNESVSSWDLQNSACAILLHAEKGYLWQLELGFPQPKKTLGTHQQLISIIDFSYMGMCQNLVPLVNIKIAGKWMFIPLKMYL